MSGPQQTLSETLLSSGSETTISVYSHEVTLLPWGGLINSCSSLGDQKGKTKISSTEFQPGEPMNLQDLLIQEEYEGGAY